MTRTNRPKNGWFSTVRKDSNTGKIRPIKILMKNGQEVEHHWVEIQGLSTEFREFQTGDFLNTLYPETYSTIEDIVERLGLDVDIDKKEYHMKQGDVHDIEYSLEKGHKLTELFTSGEIEFDELLKERNITKEQYEKALSYVQDIENDGDLEIGLVLSKEISNDELKRIDVGLYNLRLLGYQLIDKKYRSTAPSSEITKSTKCSKYDPNNLEEFGDRIDGFVDDYGWHPKNGWDDTTRKDPVTGRYRPIRIKMVKGKAVEYQWKD